jgi:hypothetical protein
VLLAQAQLAFLVHLALDSATLLELVLDTVQLVLRPVLTLLTSPTRLTQLSTPLHMELVKPVQV